MGPIRNNFNKNFLINLLPQQSVDNQHQSVTTNYLMIIANMNIVSDKEFSPMIL